MFFLPQNKLLIFLNKPIPRRALEQVFAFGTMFSSDHFSDIHTSVRNAWDVICKYDGKYF